MKFLILFTLILIPAISSANDVQMKLSELEGRVEALETAITQKLGHCEMVYRHYNYRLNICDKGTFARSLTDVGGNVFSIDCGYYQLQCSTDYSDKPE